MVRDSPCKQSNPRPRGFQYAQTMAIMILIVATVSLLDLLSARLRKALI